MQLVIVTLRWEIYAVVVYVNDNGCANYADTYREDDQSDCGTKGRWGLVMMLDVIFI